MSEVRYGTPSDLLWGRRVSTIYGPAAVDVAVPTTGELAGACALTFGAGSSALVGTAATLAATCALVFGHGSSTLIGAGALVPETAVPELRMQMQFTPVGTLTLNAVLAGTTAMAFTLDGALATGGAMAGSTAMVFGYDAVISSEQAFETPILIMAPRLAV